jgi:ankyrin repeat protein
VIKINTRGIARVIVTVSVIVGVQASWPMEKPEGDDLDTLNSELVHAAQAGDYARLARALRNGADPEARDNNWERSALHWASLKGHSELVRELLRYRASPFARDRRGKTPLELARAGDPLNEYILDPSGTLATPVEAERERFKEIEKLLTKEREIRARERREIAHQREQARMAEPSSLFRDPVGPRAQDERITQTARLTRILESGRGTLDQALQALEDGADADARGHDGNPLLFHAALRTNQREAQQFVELLARYVLNINPVNTQGQSLIELVRSRPDRERVRDALTRALRERGMVALEPLDAQRRSHERHRGLKSIIRSLVGWRS